MGVPVFGSCMRLMLVVYLGLVANVTVSGTEYVRQESPQPATAKDLEVSIDLAFADVPLSDRFLMSEVKSYLEDKPAFWRDARFHADLRTYHFSRLNENGSDPEATVTGGTISFESGWWKNFAIKAGYYNSTELAASGGNTGLLEPGRNNISVLGEANLRYRFTDTFLEGSVIQLYRQSMNLPFINKHDIRQVPASHEGYTIARNDSEFDYIVGHLTQFKDYDSNEFVKMSEAAGAFGSDKGVSLAGAHFKLTEGIDIGAINYYGWDTFNTFFVEGTAYRGLGSKSDLRLSAQITDQRSVGDELVGDFDTQQIAVKATLGWQGAIFTLGGSVVADDAGIRKPWGGTPSYLSIQRLDFDRANEKAVLYGLSYNTDFFSTLGLSSFINVVHGWDAQTSFGGEDLPDRTEYDLTIDYKPPGGFLQGLWIRARYNYIDIEDSGEDVHDVRLIVNYTLPFL